jgi:hypothetical protein
MECVRQRAADAARRRRFHCRRYDGGRFLEALPGAPLFLTSRLSLYTVPVYKGKVYGCLRSGVAVSERRFTEEV